MCPVDADDAATPTHPRYCPRLATAEGGGFVLKRRLGVPWAVISGQDTRLQTRVRWSTTS